MFVEQQRVVVMKISVKANRLPMARNGTSEGSSYYGRLVEFIICLFVCALPVDFNLPEIKM